MFDFMTQKRKHAFSDEIVFVLWTGSLINMGDVVCCFLCREMGVNSVYSKEQAKKIEYTVSCGIWIIFIF